MKEQLLSRYRLSAYYAANKKATVQEGARATGSMLNGASFYYNCVHLHDPKGAYRYDSMQHKMSHASYNNLLTRFSHTTQGQILDRLKKGYTVCAVARDMGLHYQPVTIFSIVFRMVYHLNVYQRDNAWTPYSAECFEEMARQLKQHKADTGEVPATMQPELAIAIEEMFLKQPAGTLQRETEDLLNECTDTFLGKIDLADEKAKKPLLEMPSKFTQVNPPPFAGMTDQQASKIEARLASIEEILKGLTSDLIDPETIKLSALEERFALDVIPPHAVNRWVSKEALTLFPKLVKGGYITTGDDAALLYELETARLIEIPRGTSGGLMDDVTLFTDQLKITKRGWTLHRLIWDICEQASYCCLTDLGAFMGFNIKVKESED